MVRDPAERERRTERRGREGTNVDGIKRERRGERGRRGVCGERRGGVAFLHSPSCPRVFGQARASGEGRKVEGGGEERDGGKGRGRCGFCLLPTFQSQS